MTLVRAIQEHNLEAQTVADTVGAGSGIFLPEPWITDHTPAPEEFRLPGAHEPEATIRQPASEAAVFGESSRLEISLL
ncbi:MAG: hypothetical protein LUD68_09250, partial [Rikenellaceae bacterium]|nr:hypothetical protein [Rikenellaceae bacterium]